MRQALDVCDGDCPNLHFTKCVHKVVIDHKSDPLVSSDDGECHNVYEKEIGVHRQGMKHDLSQCLQSEVYEGIRASSLHILSLTIPRTLLYHSLSLLPSDRLMN